MSTPWLSQAQELALLAVLGHGDTPAPGASITRAIELQRVPVCFKTIYTALGACVRAGLLQLAVGKGGSRSYYTITPLGRAAVAEAAAVRRQLVESDPVSARVVRPRVPSPSAMR